MKRIFALSCFALFCLTILSAQDIVLPTPVKSGGMPLMDALSKRASTREFSAEEIDDQVLSNLLWAAWGFNREDKRTAPSSMNKQEVELCVVKKSGAYLWDAKNNILKQLSKLDLRSFTYSQAYVGPAPINIVFVGNQNSGVNCGYISQNIYLYCASEGLGTVARGSFDGKALSKALNLTEAQVPVLAQTVGKRKTAEK